MPRITSSPCKAPSLTRQAEEHCTTRDGKISKRVNFLPVSHIRAAQMIILQLGGQSTGSKQKITPKVEWEDLWGHPLQPHQHCEHQSALQCCLCTSPPRSGGSGRCPTPKISSERPETSMCQRKKAGGNKLSPLCWAHTVGGL